MLSNGSLLRPARHMPLTCQALPSVILRGMVVENWDSQDKFLRQGLLVVKNLTTGLILT